MLEYVVILVDRDLMFEDEIRSRNGDLVRIAVFDRFPIRRTSPTAAISTGLPFGSPILKMRTPL
ncbi:hypothetical protein EBZ70_13030 [bacterium]|nr:hypothetical protein [bacterium]